MSYKLKTLIVFDTNSLRSTDEGEVAYNFFAFGKPFQIIEQEISEKGLAEEIHLAVSDWAISELKDQKEKQYQTDVENYKKLAKRLSGLPHTGEIMFPDVEFNCTDYLEEKATEFITSKPIKRLEIKEEIANTVLRSMMSRVMKGDKKSPFANSGKYKDAGFKDNLVWESLMNYDEVINYDKIIFLTRDGDFNKHCEVEFRDKWQRHIIIVNNENNVLAEISKDYENYIKERAIYEFAESEYFVGYLNDDVKEKTLIIIDEIEQPITEFKIDIPCNNVSRLPPNEDGAENILVSSKLTIIYKWDEDTKEQQVEALTLISDEETKEIISTEYDYNLQ